MREISPTIIEQDLSTGEPYIHAVSGTHAYRVGAQLLPELFALEGRNVKAASISEHHDLMSALSHGKRF